MSEARIAQLADRGVLHVAGIDAEKLLQDVITNDMDLLRGQPALHAALLTPQGKILFEFFVAKAADGFLLETGAEQVAGLAKRLAMYRLRAKVDISDASADYKVFALWGASPQSPGEAAKTVSFADPRLAGLGLRILAEAQFSADVVAATNGSDATADDYHAHRIALGVPEAGKDYALGDAFPHEADMDLLNGVSFGKGCFVGQEVVSRMQHRSVVRKRVVPVEVVGEGQLQSGADVTAGAATIGKVGSVAGRRALALLRLDRAAEAKAKGERLLVGDAEVVVRKPEWATFDPASPATAEMS